MPEHTANPPSKQAASTREIELFQPVQLCTSTGQLRPESIGFSRTPLHACNLSGHWPRKKKWNYWCITTPDWLFSITLSNIDYMGLAFAYFLDFGSRQFTEQTVMNPFGMGFEMPPGVNQSISFHHDSLQVAFNEAADGIQILAKSPNFGGKQLEADLKIHRPAGHETLNVVIPWNPDCFQFTSKQNCLPCEGTIMLGADRYTAQADQSFACLDFGRGIWPYRGFWNWASFSGIQNGRSVGVNLGGGWTDGTGLTENGILVDGKLTKLAEDMVFTYDTGNFMGPWKLHTRETDRVNLDFIPFYERVAKTNALVVKSEVHQMIGRFNGILCPDQGEPVVVKDMIGWAEDHHARW